MILDKRLMRITFLIAVVMIFTNCKKEPEELLPVVDPVIIDWDKNAGDSFSSLKDLYWNAEKGIFWSDNYNDTQFNYWWQAHGLDAIVDASLRVNDDRYFEMISDFYDGINETNNGFINHFYDDMSWMALAFLRAHDLTGEAKYLACSELLWEDIITGWNETHGGGICWNKTDIDYKNTCSNATAAILSFRLHRVTGENKYLVMGENIMVWLTGTLVDPETGIVWDGIGRNGGNQIDYNWLFTYNQGVYIGACVEYYNISNNSEWLQKAVKTADRAIIQLSSASQVLKSEGDGDGGLFKGVFIRYLKLLADSTYVNEATQKLLAVSPYVDEATQSKYNEFITKNAESVWKYGKSTTYPYLFNHDWTQKPGGVIDLSVELSAVFLLEAIAALDSKSNGYLD